MANKTKLQKDKELLAKSNLLLSRKLDEALEELTVVKSQLELEKSKSEKSQGKTTLEIEDPNGNSLGSFIVQWDILPDEITRPRNFEIADIDLDYINGCEKLFRIQLTEANLNVKEI